MKAYIFLPLLAVLLLAAVPASAKTATWSVTEGVSPADLILVSGESENLFWIYPNDLDAMAMGTGAADGDANLDTAFIDSTQWGADPGEYLLVAADGDYNCYAEEQILAGCIANSGYVFGTLYLHSDGIFRLNAE